MTIDFITLGCSKNLVDSERVIARLERLGYAVRHDADELKGQIAVVNTCGFIGDAKEESINTILELVQAKTEGRLAQIYVMGCLSERYKADLLQEIPEVDGWYGKFDYDQLVEQLSTLNSQLSSELCSSERQRSSTKRAQATLNSQLSTPNFQELKNSPLPYERRLTTPSHYAYIKISEGCDRRCSYCAIPLITGRHVSRPMDEILDEVRWLVSKGVKEFQIIAQELTYYGVDLYKRRCLAELIDRMAQIEGVQWIRLHYAYPADFPMDLPDVMARHPNVCKYLDIALQHISDNMLQAMHRHVTKQQTLELIRRLRTAVPDIHLRTTLMVGFPGETDDDFNQLLDFVREARFERMGAFAYSEEEGTYSALHLTDDVPPEVKQSRLDRLMRLQQKVSTEVQAQKVGKQMRVIIDRKEGEYWIGRTQYDSPEVDPEVLISSDSPMAIGSFYDVMITSSDEFDLYAIINDSIR